MNYFYIHASKYLYIYYFELASFYRFGTGIAKDEQKAFELYKKAAEQGHVDACYKLAVCYEVGIGTVKDKMKAAEWYNKAAEKGDKRAKVILKELRYS